MYCAHHQGQVPLTKAPSPQSCFLKKERDYKVVSCFYRFKGFVSYIYWSTITEALDYIYMGPLKQSMTPLVAQLYFPLELMKNISLSLFLPDNWPSRLWTSVWSAWRTSLPGPAWTMRKMMMRTNWEPTHSRSSQVGVTPRRDQQRQPSAPASPPPPHPQCYRVAERHPQAERHTPSPALSASRMHLLDRNK